MIELPSAPLPALRQALLKWYDAERRALPWRTPHGSVPDPYRVWLSEVMLQQTRIETVRPYYARWLDRFPTLRSLADAPLDDVLKLWEGLGYYSRARNFHRAVREVAAHYSGQVPEDPATFRSLPGVGRYTAGAVTSIAFARAEAVVDGNVRRVFARWTDQPSPAENELWTLAEALVEGDRPGDLNQALMELGATVCTPRNPRCDTCPARFGCRARQAGTQGERPEPKRRKPLPHEDTAVAVVRRADDVLLVRRRPESRLGGLWAFPWTVLGAGEDAAAAAERAVRDGVGMQVRPAERLPEVPHIFTHVRATYRPVLCTWERGEPVALEYADVRWVRWAELPGYALPVAQRKIAALAMGPPVSAAS